MASIKPFKGFLYNKEKVDISKTVAPPYDVISPSMQSELYDLSSYNIVRLILGKEELGDNEKNNKYTRAKEFLNSWVSQKVLLEDAKECIYFYMQTYVHEGDIKNRFGFIAAMRLESPEKSNVLPHEFTFPKPKEDRLKLMNQVEANLSPVFSLFSDDDNAITSILKKTCSIEKPYFNINFEGVEHKLWKVESSSIIQKIQEGLKGKQVYIADGHHRFETALLYRNLRRQKDDSKTEKGYDYIMMYFSSLDDAGLTILPTYRVIKDINMSQEDLLKIIQKDFELESCSSIDDLFGKMNIYKDKIFCFGLYLRQDKYYLLKLKNENIIEQEIKEKKPKEWKRLDVTILHKLIIQKLFGNRETKESDIAYTRDAVLSKKLVDGKEYFACFFVNPTKLSQVREIANVGEKMPQKATYFYPKLLSGLVIHKF